MDVNEHGFICEEGSFPLTESIYNQMNFSGASHLLQWNILIFENQEGTEENQKETIEVKEVNKLTGK